MQMITVYDRGASRGYFGRFMACINDDRRLWDCFYNPQISCVSCYSNAIV